MPNLFSNSKIISMIYRLGELVILNICFILSCLPVVTVGPAKAALYTACFRMDAPGEQRCVRSFFRGFRENLKQGILFWVTEALLCIFLAWCALMCYADSGIFHLAWIPFLVLLAVIVMVWGFAYPLISQFENTTRATLKNAWILSLGYLPTAVCTAILDVIPLILILVRPAWFIQGSMIWLLLYFSAAAYANTKLLRPVFAPFLRDPAADTA